MKLSPLELWNLDLSKSSNLRNFVLSPATACPKLTDLDLTQCKSLSYVLVQSTSVKTIKLSKCEGLNKVLLHCPRLSTLQMTDCPNLETVMIWSDDMTAVDLAGCTGIIDLKLQCPNMVSLSLSSCCRCAWQQGA